MRGPTYTIYQGSLCTSSAEEVSDHPYFVQFRLTDAGIAGLAADAHLVITDDRLLYHRLANNRQAAINFNHLRTANG